MAKAVLLEKGSCGLRSKGSKGGGECGGCGRGGGDTLLESGWSRIELVGVGKWVGVGALVDEGKER